jgi:SAM-dependent methyltransferase
MSAAIDLRPEAVPSAPVRLHPAREARAADELNWLLDNLRRNRFLPAPAPDSVYVGDGDFRAIGAEFLGHFVRMGGLRPHHRVIDIGCGIGRMAVPLTQYLDESAGGRYDGLDPVSDGVTWCARNITPVYPNFRFCRLDIAHPIYNPQGRIPPADVILPFRDACADMALMISVATHLTAREIAAYAREVTRVLEPGGKLFLTAFLVGPGDATREGARPRFVRGEAPRTWVGDPRAPLAAIGFDAGLVESLLVHAGLELVLVARGSWRGTPAGHYQDILVARRPLRPGQDRRVEEKRR